MANVSYGDPGIIELFEKAASSLVDSYLVYCETADISAARTTLNACIMVRDRINYVEATANKALKDNDPVKEF